MMLPIDPTKHGMTLSFERTDRVDTFEFVYNRWLAEQAEMHGDDPAAVEPARIAAAAVQSYLELARRMFSENQPVAQDFMGATLSLRFQDGSVLAFCNCHTPEAVAANLGQTNISQTTPPRDGKGRTVQTPHWGVTTGNSGGL